MTGPLQGEQLTNALEPIASALVAAVHAQDANEVGSLFAQAAQLAGDELPAVRALTVLLAGACSEDHTLDAALGWTNNPTAYRQYRSTTDALTASLRAGRTTTEQERGA